MRKSNYPLLVLLVLAVFILPATVYLALTNKDIRSSAAGNPNYLTEDFGCGPKKCGGLYCQEKERCILKNRFPFMFLQNWSCINDQSCKRLSPTPGLTLSPTPVPTLKIFRFW